MSERVQKCSSSAQEGAKRAKEKGVRGKNVCAQTSKEEKSDMVRSRG